MNTMQAGANIAVNQSDTIEIIMSWLPLNASVDIAAFALTEQNKVRSDSDFIYLNGSIDIQGEFISLSLNAGKPVFKINIAKVPATINKIQFVLASDNGLSNIQQMAIEVKNIANFIPENSTLNALVLGELYFKNQQWKFRALGQGYAQGMAFIANQFGTQFIKTAPASFLPETVPNNNSQTALDTIRDELPDIRHLTRPEKIKEHIENLKKFSWGWMLSSLVVFILAEIAIAGLFEANLFVSFIPHSFRYLVEVVSFALSFLIGGLIVGLISPSVRVLEPAIAAFISVILLLSSGGFFTPNGFANFSIMKMLIGGGIASALAAYGAVLGEKIEALLGNKASKEYINKRR